MYADREEEAIQQRRASSSREKGHGRGIGRGANGHSRHGSSMRRSPSPSVSPVSRSSSMSRSQSRSPGPASRVRSSRRRSPSPGHIRGSSRRRRASYTSSDDENSEPDRRPASDKRQKRGASDSLNAEELRRRALLSRNSRPSRASPGSASPSRDARESSTGASLASRLDGRRNSRDMDRKRAERHERRRGRDLILDSDRGSAAPSSKRIHRDDEELDDDDDFERRRRLGSGRARNLELDDDAYARRMRRDSIPRSRASGSRYDSEDDVEETRSRSRRGGSSRREQEYDDPHLYRGPPPYDAYRAPPPRSYYDRYGPPSDRYGPRDPYDYYARPPRRYTRSPSPPPPPRRRRVESGTGTPDATDYENRSVFCSQLAARLTQRDLGEFFEDKLGDRTVVDVRIVMDKITGRSKGLGYVELKDESLVEKALALSSTVVFGIPIIVQRTEAARNRGAGDGESASRPNMPGDASNKVTTASGEAIHLDPKSASSAQSRLYVGNLYFNLTDEDVRTVFEPFGPIISVDLHRDPETQKSKGFAFVQYANVENAENAIQHMNGFQLAGRSIRVGHVNAAKMDNPTSVNQSNNGEGSMSGLASNGDDPSGAQATLTSAFDEGGGGGLNPMSRAALMEKLARIEKPEAVSQSPTEQQRPASIPQAVSRGVLVRNMFNPEEETERGWDTDLAEDVKEECEAKYGKVDAIKVDPNSLGEVWIQFANVEGARKAVAGLNGRFFGGRSIQAAHVNEGILSTMLERQKS